MNTESSKTFDIERIAINRTRINAARGFYTVVQLPDQEETIIMSPTLASLWVIFCKLVGPDKSHEFNPDLVEDGLLFRNTAIKATKKQASRPGR